jgi:hypothetical protein
MSVGSGRPSPDAEPAVDDDDSSPERSNHSRRRWPSKLVRSRVLLFVLVVAVYGTSPVVTNGDSFLVAPTAQSILKERNLDIDEYVGAGTDGGVAYVSSGQDGHPGYAVNGVDLPRSPGPAEHDYDYFPWTTAVLAVPIVAVLRIPGSLLHVSFFDPDRMVTTGDTGLINLLGGSLLTAAAVLVISVMAWHGLDLEDDRRRRVAFVVGAVAAFGSAAWSTLSRALFSQTSSVLFLSVALLAALRLARLDRDDASGSSTRLALLLGAAVAAAYTARPTNAVSVVVLGAWLLLTNRRALRGYVLGGLAVAVPWLAVNLATWGTLQPPYFSSDRAHLRASTLEAMAANLVSPNRGLLVFSCVMVLSIVGFVLAVKGRGQVPRSLAIAGGVVAILHLIVVSGAGEDWWAGASYGPRFMADLLPVAALLALPAVAAVSRAGARRWWVRSSLALALVSVLMNLPGAWSKPAQCWSLDPVRVDDDPSRVWDWRDPQALRPVRVLRETHSVKDAVFQRCDALLDH